ncbi:MAG: branched-chain amino acid transport system ATP-binding protein livF, partial [Actinomycetota bacterium]|nr:branched-chain amino acid transport system ATP-binding protein livF [Actinomycetota bacterium]
VLLVEQSVNIALSLVDHAYFMEKGEIRFDGRAEELIRRPDLLRAVFLEGASKGGRR